MPSSKVFAREVEGISMSTCTSRLYESLRFLDVNDGTVFWEGSTKVDVRSIEASDVSKPSPAVAGASVEGLLIGIV
jgi:hypothetical protein